MGEIRAAALVAHVPTIMLPEKVRVAIGGGSDTTLVAGLARLRDALDQADVDTLVIFDTHWFTTTEHIVSGRERYRGVYTSDELPTVIADLEYEYPGAPDLARLTEKVAQERGIRCVNTANAHVTLHYATLNLLHYLHRGEQVMSVGICQTAEAHNFLDLGGALKDAVSQAGCRAALLASGGMSHSFWPLDTILSRGGYSPENLRTPEARDADARILELWASGDHEAVIDYYPEYRRFSPEGFFGHYLMLVGALGGKGCTARGRMLSDYENAVGTGQVHVWFELGGVGGVAARLGPDARQAGGPARPEAADPPTRKTTPTRR